MLGFINLLLILRLGQKTWKLRWFHNKWKNKKFDPWSARLYQGAWAEAEAEREVGSGVQRVSWGVSILLIEFHEWQATFQIFFLYKTLKTELLESVF